MDETTTNLAIVAALTMICFGAFVFYLYERWEMARRRRRLRGWAEVKGFAFEVGPHEGMSNLMRGFECLRTGFKNYAFNIANGTWKGHRFHAFDYHYQTETVNSEGRTETTHYYFSAVVLNCEAGLSNLEIRPEGIFDKVASLVGMSDFQCGYPAFDRQFHVKSSDPKWAKEALSPLVMERLLVDPVFIVQIDNFKIMARQEGLMSPNEFEIAGDLLADLLGLLVGSAGARGRQQEAV